MAELQAIAKQERVGHLFRLPPAGTVVHLLLAATVVLTLDALIRDRGDWDYPLINAVRKLQFPGDDDAMRAASRLTGSEGAIAAWFILLVTFLALRRWLEALALSLLPLGGIISQTMQGLVDRPRPDLSRINGLESAIRAAEDQDYASFPSGHVLGAVLLYGLLFFIAREIPWRWPRIAVRACLVSIIVLTGLSRIWLGSHWFGDVISAYALGGAMLGIMILAYRRAEPHVRGVPLIHARALSHDEVRPHAHALTSLILFRDGEAWKVYAPGFVPQAFYWLSFQAAFPYANNEAALAAALHRRNLAGLLTEYWYGERRVAELLRIDIWNGRPAVVSRFIEGKEPDHSQARPFLFDLAARFDAAGLPTWQIDPRQPRSFGNLVETDDGRLMIIDLESGIVSPVASPRAWLRAIRRTTVPMFDDVYFDVTRDYATREAAAMRARMGDDWYEALLHEIDLAEQAAIAWHGSEPRIWSRLLRWLFTGFGVRTWRRRARRRKADAEERAIHFIGGSVERWQAEGRISPDDAEEILQSVETPEFRAVLPHFGVHLMIGVALRFPFGSIARVTYTGGCLLGSTLLLLSGMRSPASWKRSVSIHSPLVLLIAAMPAIGTFSYLTSKPMRSQANVGRLVIDGAAEKIPWHLYERLGLRRLVAGPAQSRPETPGRTGEATR